MSQAASRQSNRQKQVPKAVVKYDHRLTKELVDLVQNNLMANQQVLAQALIDMRTMQEAQLAALQQLPVLISESIQANNDNMATALQSILGVAAQGQNELLSQIRAVVEKEVKPPSVTIERPATGFTIDVTRDDDDKITSLHLETED